MTHFLTCTLGLDELCLKRAWFSIDYRDPSDCLRCQQFGQMNLTQEVYILFNGFALRNHRQGTRENAGKEVSFPPAWGRVMFCANVLQLLFICLLLCSVCSVRGLEVSHQPVSIPPAAAVGREILIWYNMPVTEVSSAAAAAAKRQM